MLFSVFMLALRSVRRNMLRSFLTILGIVIGVSAVITMVTLGKGATQAIEAKITSLGTNLLMISPGQRIGGGGGGGVPQFTEADADAIASQIGGVAAVAPQGRTSATVVANGRNWATSVTGSSNAWFETGNWQLASGRLFEPDEQLSGAAVCIIGETVRRELYGATEGETGLGQPLRIKQFTCDVVGILAAKGQGGMGDQDDAVVLPLHTLQRRVTGSRKVSSLMVSMQDGADSAPLKASLRQLLRERRKLADSDDDNFNIFDTQQLADTLSSTMGVLTSLLGAVAAGGRHRHHEHHAGERHRAHPRDWPSPGRGRARRRGAAAVPHRGRGAVGAWRGGGHRDRHGSVLRRCHPDGCSLRVRPGDQPGGPGLLGGHRHGVRLLPGAPCGADGPDRGAAARVAVVRTLSQGAYRVR
jgi:putative ABC transport system permease protein